MPALECFASEHEHGRSQGTKPNKGKSGSNGKGIEAVFREMSTERQLLKNIRLHLTPYPAPSPPLRPTLPPGTSLRERNSDAAVNQFFKSIAEDLGFESDHFDDNASSLVDLGVDSPMTMIIVERLEKELGVKVPLSLLAQPESSTGTLRAVLTQFG